MLVGLSKLGQLEDNLKSIELELTAEDIASLDQLTQPRPLYRDWYTASTLDTETANALK